MKFRVKSVYSIYLGEYWLVQYRYKWSPFWRNHCTELTEREAIISALELQKKFYEQRDYKSIKVEIC